MHSHQSIKEKLFQTFISYKKQCRSVSSGNNLPFLSSKYSVCWAGFDHWREVLSFWSTLQVKFAVPPSTTVTFCVSGNCPWLPEEGGKGCRKEGNKRKKKRKYLSCRIEFIAAASTDDRPGIKCDLVWPKKGSTVHLKKLHVQYIPWETWWIKK